jgi:hypothetical protein
VDGHFFLLSLRREIIVPVAIALPDVAIAAMNQKLGLLRSRAFAPALDGSGLSRVNR